MHKKAIVSVLLILVLYSCQSIKDRPYIATYNDRVEALVKVDSSFSKLGNNSIVRNKQGLWELYVEGDPLERGLATGELTKELMYKQEKALIGKVTDIIPSRSYLSFLKFFVFLFNRELYKHVDNEFKTEIYGISRSASDEFDDIGDKYVRMLYYHAAHDIGHALQDLALVGCTSFAAWGNETVDGSLLVGRNFDFYAGDEFSKEKIIAFVNPDKGHKFMSVTWGGMIGVVSGMNDQGLTVTINAGSSGIPFKASTPISIVTREILQYASTIEEALEIAEKRKVFVSESILVGSAKDKKAVSIEVSPKAIGVYDVQSSNRLICSNHFQSDVYANDKRNQQHIEESHSEYRFERMEELIRETDKISPEKAVEILRNKEGLHDKTIGYGNEKAINQLLAHHGIVFKPEQLLVWVSSNPYQLGEFVAYDLKTVFDRLQHRKSELSMASAELNIAEDPFVDSDAFKDYERFRVMKRDFTWALNNKKEIDNTALEEFADLNPENWETYYILGEYYFWKKYFAKARNMYEKALSKEVTTLPDKHELLKKIKKCSRKTNR